MKKKFTFIALFFLCLSFSLSAQITRVDLTFTPVDGGDAITVDAINGINGFVVSGPINLVESTQYRLAITLGDQDAALKARQSELQFFFVTDTEDLLIGAVNYDDSDANNLPVGFTTLLTTECKEAQEDGTLQIILNDYAGSKTDTSSINGGTKLLDLSWHLNVNNDPSAPPCENEEEIITDVILTFTPANGGMPVVVRAQDPDGEGVLGLEILDDIVLASNTTYNLSLDLRNEIEGESITEEIEEEEDEHLFLFGWTAGVFADPMGDGNADNRTDAVNYNDFDEDGLPVGLRTTWTTAGGMNGTFRVVLKHQPDIKTATSGINDGGTDVDLTWNIQLSTEINRVDLTFTPVDGGNAVTANAVNGANGYTLSGPIDLVESTEYQLTIALGDQDANFKAQQEDLQFFFVVDNDELLVGDVQYGDADANTLPVGFTTTLTTECKEAQESGTLQIVLNDFAGNKTGMSSVMEGLRLLNLAWPLNVNDDPSAPECENEEEIITDVVLTFVPQNGGDTVRARAQDPDGEGVLGLEILDDIMLASNTTYNLSLELTNAIEGESITEEIEEEEDEHLFLFAWTEGVFSDPAGDGNIDNRADLVNYNDFDEDNLPVGLSTTWTTADDMGQTGTFRLVLKHQPDIKTATSGINDGGTDVDLTWNIQTMLVNTTQAQMRLNQSLRLAPNPAKQGLNWTIDNQISTATANIRIFDQMGRLVLQTTTNEPNLNISTLNPGNYIFQVQTEDTLRVQRFVKVN